jgi:osmotically inducible protein OsmC
MIKAERRAEIVWEGNLLKGTGILQLGSGAGGTLPVTWPSRTERVDGRTSPEELMAAAHASCYTMVLTHALSMQGTTPERLTVNAVCTLETVEGILTITTMKLHVRGKVPGIDLAHFKEEAHKAEQNCAVSRVLRQGLTIQLQAELES